MNNEPVAWISPSNNFYKSRMEAVNNGEQMVTPLYTHPAKTLTDEEITELANEYLCYLQDYEATNVYEFAREILRKAQEK